jgi:hypothetical protein
LKPIPFLLGLAVALPSSGRAEEGGIAVFRPQPGASVEDPTPLVDPSYVLDSDGVWGFYPLDREYIVALFPRSFPTELTLMSVYSPEEAKRLFSNAKAKPAEAKQFLDLSFAGSDGGKLTPQAYLDEARASMQGQMKDAKITVVNRREIKTAGAPLTVEEVLITEKGMPDSKILVGVYPSKESLFRMLLSPVDPKKAADDVRLFEQIAKSIKSVNAPLTMAAVKKLSLSVKK